MKINSIICLCLLSILSFSNQTQAQATIQLQQSDSAVMINKNIYGHFAEHLGRCIYDGLYVGEKSNIPNTEGVRNDIISALKELKIPNLRWPGGCFADTYHWKDGVGPQSERPTIVNTWWGNVTEDNSFGTHNFLNLCEELGAEPYLSGNVGSGTVQELSDWIQYTNFKGRSPMSDWRKENGKEEPWGVKFWGIGNEAWGCGGNMTAEYYANEYRKYATFMSGAGLEGGLYKIASGASDGDYHWTEVLMRDIPHNLLQGVALHHYSVIDWNAKGSSVDFSEKQYFEIMKQSWLMEELVTKHTEVMDKYDPEKKVDLIVDEWGGWYDVMPDTNPGFLYQQNTMRDAMIAGMNLNIFNNHAERVKMANLAQVVNVLQAVILTEGEKMILTPTYHVMKMYNVHQDAELIPLNLDTPDYEFNGEKLPAVSASASKDSTGTVHMSMINIDSKKENKVTISLQDLNIKDVSAQILTSKTLQDHNTFENPDKIKPADFKDFKVKKGNLELTIPAFSVVVITGKG
ncbi:MAG: alpha-L-arabinofuranosidase C-terminal domain-containing protein [Leeuwenhoekiella sp.]